MKRYTKVPRVDTEWDGLRKAKFLAYEKPEMSYTDRLGLAFCRFNNWLWDDIVGECPKVFYNLPHCSENGRSRDEYIKIPLSEITAKLGEENCSKYWWLYSMGKTENEWREWYFGERLKEARRDEVLWSIVRGLWLLLMGGAVSLWVMRLIR